MRLALVGLEGSGKTTLLDAISEVRVPRPPPRAQTETHVQVVRVKDPRLERCREIFRPRKYTPAGLEVLDPPGLPPGDSEAERARRARLLAALRDADAYVVVVRGFRTDRYPYERPEPDPKGDLRRILEELVVADLAVLEGRAARLREGLARRSRSADADRLELAAVERCLALLEAGGDLRALDLDEAEAKRIRGFQLFARKPILVAHDGPGVAPAGLVEGMPLPVAGTLALDAHLEAEVAAMDPADRPAFLAEFGLETPASDRFVHEVYRAVGLRSFFTVGEDEVRAWTIRAGDDAVTAAGKIHTDLARGFVRAEVFTFEELDRAGGMRELKARGAIRLEPRGYEVRDGDIVHVRSAT
jgi:ribosome-binding ATPase YchF (GTP1/OBG family)